MSARLDLKGQKFGRLTALSYIRKNETSYWKCICDCGKEKIIRSSDLQSGRTKSCGCLRKETTALNGKNNIKHGLKNTPEYSVLKGIKERCTNSNREDYKFYGGRGIKICKRWSKGNKIKTAIECFVEDMGFRPGKEYSIERKDVNGDYEPNNCVWALEFDQKRNRRDNHWVEYQGTAMVLADAIKLAGCIVYQSTASKRIKKGWSVEDAVEAPSFRVTSTKRYTT